MKKAIKRILLSLVILVVLLVVSIFVFPTFYKGKVVQLIRNEANKVLLAELSFDDDISLSIIKDFPKLSIGLKNLGLTGIEGFSSDTLLYAGELGLTVNLMTAIKGESIDLYAINLENTKIHMLVNDSGEANWEKIIAASEDETETETDTTSSNLNILLEKFTLKDCRFLYDDKSLPFVMDIDGLSGEITGNMDLEVFDIGTQLTSKALTLAYDGVPYLYKTALDLDANFIAELTNDYKLQLKENVIKLNALELKADGLLAYLENGDMDFDLSFAAPGNEFKSFLSLIPAIYASDFEDIKTTGTLAFDGKLKGKMTETSMPAYNLNLKVENAAFHYPDLPTGVNNINIDAHIDNPDGKDDNLVVNVPKLHAVVENEPFDAQVLFKTPISDPYIAAKIKGGMGLDKIQKFVPLDEGMELSGLVKADVEVKGNMSAIEQSRYEDFYAAGMVGVEKIHYADASLDYPVDVAQAELEFSPQVVTLKNTDLKVGHSDLNLFGALDNLYGWLFSDELLKGDFKVNSKILDVNQLMGAEEETAETTPEPNDTAQLEAIQIPANLDLALALNVGKMYYDNLEIENLKGEAQVINQSVIMKDWGLGLLGGTVGLNGAYHSANAKNPDVEFNLDLKDFNVPKLYQYFGTVQSFAPVAEKLNAVLNANFSMKMGLDEFLNPNLNQLDADGILDLFEVKLTDISTLKALDKKLGINKLDGSKVKELLLSFNIDDGKVKLKPFTLPLKEALLNLEGFTTLKQQMDFTGTLQLPAAWVQKGTQSVNQLTAGTKFDKIQLNEDDIMDVVLGITGSFANPKVNLNLKDIGKNLTDNLKDQAKKELEKQKAAAEAKAKEEIDKAKQKAREEAEKARQEVEQKAKEAEEKAKAELEKKKAEAERKIEEEKKKKEEELKKKGKKELENLFNR